MARQKPGIYKRGNVWWIRYTDHRGQRQRKSASTDQSVAMKMLGDALGAVEKMRAGMISADPAEGKRPIAEHLTEYLADLERKGRDAMYRYTIGKRVEAAVKAKGWRRLTDCSVRSISEYLTTLSVRDLSAKTINDHRADLGAFFAWCVQTGRMEMNPCSAVQKSTVKREKKRRALSVLEIKALLEGSPPDRRLVYLTLAYTGLRRAEAAALRWGHLHLDCANPYVELPASITKSGRPESVPLVSALAEVLLAARGDAEEGSPLFEAIPAIETFRKDLAAAGIDEKDERGRVVVLHSLRHSLATMLAASRVPMAVAQRIMRHRDIRLTAETYTDEGLLPMAEAIKALPALVGLEAGAMTRAATGTDGPVDCAKTVPERGPNGSQPGKSRRHGPAGRSAQMDNQTALGTSGHHARKNLKAPRSRPFRTRSRANRLGRAYRFIFASALGRGTYSG